MEFQVAVTPVGKASFRAPSPFTAGVHGPGAFGVSLSYPYPSTISGVLAGVAYSKGLCDPASAPAGGYSDQRECIRALLSNLLGCGEVNDFYVRAGLLRSGGGYYAYIGSPVFPETGRLASLFKRIAGNSSKPPALTASIVEEVYGTIREADSMVVKAYKSVYKGIALKATDKTTVEGMLYAIEQVEYIPRAEIIAGITVKDGCEKPESLRLPTKFGKRRTALLAIEPAGESPYTAGRTNSSGDGSGDYLLVLLTPALLSDLDGLSRDDKTGVEGVVSVDLESGLHRKLARKLLRESGLDGEVVYVPKEGGFFEHSLRVLFPGWNMAANRPRPPYLIVPPGTVLILRGVTGSKIREMAEKGVGEESDLGWGTVLPVPI